MQCQECHQRPATLHFQQIINGEKSEIKLCEVCAQEKGYGQTSDENYSLHDLLTGLFNFDTSQINPQTKQQSQQTKELQCPRCKMTFSDFKKFGKFGCASCYDTFSQKIDPILRRVHAGNMEHSGKIPKRIGGSLKRKKQIEDYRSQLKKLIEQEAFEDAAIIRDKIRALENGTDEEGSDA